MNKLLPIVLVLIVPFKLLGQRQDFEIHGNLKMTYFKSTIFTCGDGLPSHYGGVQFLTFDNGNTFIFQPTNQDGNAVNSTLRLGGFGSFHNNIVNLAVSGNVGIGSTAPQGYKLAVEGKVGAREVIVTSAPTWPDYVFNSDYKLPSLLEIESYIKQNKHLPEVPSEAEVNENGVNLGEMNALLLKKVEELTLYVIDLEKQNILLREQVLQIDTLKKEIASIKELVKH